MDILIVDDEFLARERLARMIEPLEGYRVVAQAGTAEEALAMVSQHDPDIVLMDVRMPGQDGLSAAEQLAQLEDPPTVIFCSAYDEYAIHAFTVEAAGYLLKPVKREQLYETLEKAQKLNRAQRVAMQVPAVNPDQRSHISAKTRRGVELIPLNNIYYFNADHKYVTVYHKEGETLIDDTLKELEGEFGDRFVRVHRNALVAIQYIEGMERAPAGHYEVRIKGIDTQPVVSRRHVAKLRDLLTSL